MEKYRELKGQTGVVASKLPLEIIPSGPFSLVLDRGPKAPEGHQYVAYEASDRGDVTFRGNFKATNQYTLG